MIGTVIWLRSIKLSCSKRKELGQSSQNDDALEAKGGAKAPPFEGLAGLVKRLGGRKQILEIFIQFNRMGSFSDQFYERNPSQVVGVPVVVRVLERQFTGCRDEFPQCGFHFVAFHRFYPFPSFTARRFAPVLLDEIEGKKL